ncbi:MAG: ATP-binding protein, partial [Arenimonas sp.]
MHLRLWHRLYLAFAALSILALLAFALLQQNNFQRGFLDYLNRLSLENLEAPAKKLGDEYARQGNWQFAQGNERDLMLALGLAWEQNPDAENVRPPPRRGDDPFGPPPRLDDADFRAHPPRRDDAGFRPPPRRPAGSLSLAPRILLLDANGQRVNGNPEVALDSPSIKIQNEGQTIGTLLLQPMPGLRSGLDTTFADNQIKYAAIAASLVLIGALVVAWALSRWLLAPIRALGKGARDLAAGNYATRIASTRTDELGELATDFNQMANALEKNQEARRQWGADIAHELRTPLSILRGEIQALQDGVRQPGPENLASLQAECGRLASLVDDLYQLALSDAGALSYRFEMLDLAELLQEIISSQTVAMQQAGLELQWVLPSPPIFVRADRQRLLQLFVNLLSNSLRYTDAPGHVRIEVTPVNDFWQIDVADTAPGVPPESIGKVFDRLYRVEPSRSRAFGGAGLGLSICRNIVNAHNGCIEATASAKGGLLVRVLLPASA